MRLVLLSPTNDTTNTLVNKGEKGFCQETLTKTHPLFLLGGQETLTKQIQFLESGLFVKTFQKLYFPTESLNKSVNVGVIFDYSNKIFKKVYSKLLLNDDQTINL